MKSHQLSLLGGALMCSFVIGCSGSKNSDGHFGEPNNTILEANIIESGKAYSMKIDSVGDIDWYALPVNDSGYVRLSTKVVPENLTLNVRFAEKEEWQAQKEKWLSSWMKVPATIAVSGIDTLYFAIIDDYNDAFSDEEFEFKVDFIKEFDKYESNDEADLAREVKAGETIQSYFFPESDQDWFKITVDTAGYLMLRSRKVPDDIGINVRYASRASDFDKPDFISGWMSLPAGLHVTQAGTYYFVLIDDYNDAMSEDAAEWRMDFLPEMDVTEPNNSIEEAYEIAIGETVTSRIFPMGDVDFFIFNSDSKQTILVSGKAPSDLTLNVRLHVQNDLETEKVGGWRELPVKLDLEAGKTYYLELIDDYNDAYSEEPVSIMIQKSTPGA